MVGMSTIGSMVGNNIRGWQYHSWMRVAGLAKFHGWKQPTWMGWAGLGNQWKVFLHFACSIYLGEPSPSISCLWIRGMVWRKRLVWETRWNLCCMLHAGYYLGEPSPRPRAKGECMSNSPLTNPLDVRCYWSTGKCLRSRLGVVLTLGAAYLVRWRG